MTRTGSRQVAAAQQMAPAIKTLAGQLARAGQAGPGEHAAAVACIQHITQELADLAGTAGYAVRWRWAESFLPGEVTDPGWIGGESHAAAQLIMDAASLLRGYRYLPGARPARPTPLMRRADVAWTAVDNTDRLLRGSGLYAPNPDEAARLLGAVHAAAGELVKVLAAEARLAGRVHGAQVAAAFTGASQLAGRGHGALGAVARIAAEDAPVWRSRAHRERLRHAWLQAAQP